MCGTLWRVEYAGNFREVIVEKKFELEDSDGTEIMIGDAEAYVVEKSTLASSVNIGPRIRNVRTQKWEQTLSVIGSDRQTELVTSIETLAGPSYHFFHVGASRKRTIDVTDVKNIRVDIVEDRWIRKNFGTPELELPVYQWPKSNPRVIGVVNKQSWPISVRVYWKFKGEKHDGYTDVLVLPGQREAVAPFEHLDLGSVRYEGFVETRICVR